MQTLNQAVENRLPVNVQLLAYTDQAASSPEAAQDVMRLTNILQTTLECKKLLSLFVGEIEQQLFFSGILYQYNELGIDFQYGNTQVEKNLYQYDLVINQEKLGRISFISKTALAQQAIIKLEQLLCGLLYPLRNSLMYQRAVSAAHRDALTGIYNRAAMDIELNRAVMSAQRHQYPLSILVLDIDHFKKINDGYGHAVGDRVIKQLATVLENSIRTVDMVFRYGGEEFVVLLPHTEQSGALLLAERIRRQVELSETNCKGGPIKVTVSLGIATPTTEDDAATLFDKADQALYKAKKSGRNCIRVVSEIPLSPVIS